MTPDADILLMGCANSPATYAMTTTALRTLAASTTHRVHLWLNNLLPQYHILLSNECRLLGVTCKYVYGPFNLTKQANDFIKSTTGKYIAICNADVIFFPHWLENLIDLWEEQPEWFCLMNYFFDSRNISFSQQWVMNERRIVEAHDFPSGVLVLRRDHGYLFDEQFSLWESDADLKLYMESNGLKAGYCLNARCDHLIGGVRELVNLQQTTGLTPDQFYTEAKAKMKAKWGDKYKG